MSWAQARAVRRASQPGWVVGPEKPKPGSEGMTRWKASAASAPWARGLVRGAARSRYSRKVLGQPWVRISGRASGSGERRCAKWMVWPSMVVVNCGTWLSLASQARQS
jgi:hypothetical protein